MKKFCVNFSLIYFFLLTLYISLATAENHASVEADVDRMRALISKLTDNKCFNVGGEAVLEIIVRKLQEINKNLFQENVLEISSGYGTSTNYLNNYFAKIWGLESNETALKYAREHYSKINFELGDLSKITKIFKDKTFGMIYMLNVLSSIKDSVILLQKVRNISEQGSYVVIADYSLASEADSFELFNIEGKKIKPINIKKLEMILKVLEIKLTEVINVTKEYEAYYSLIIKSIAEQKNDIISSGEFTKSEINLLEDYCQKILSLIKDEKIGGSIIIIKNVDI